jgi:predicted nucleic acid-binding protein
MRIKQVYDTTALLSLSLIKKLDILRKLDIVIFVPVSVMEELSDIGKYSDELGVAAKEVIMSGAIERVVLKKEYKSLAERLARFPRVDRREAEALALSYQISAKEMVIDDVSAIGGLVGISKVIGVEIVPSSYIFVSAYLKGVIDYDTTKSLLKELATKRGWEQSVLYETAIIMLEEAKK